MATMSKRAHRMLERRERREKRTGLNLVSLMDIFTILVFFLLVNSTEVQTLPNQKGLQMPESVAQTPPRQTLVVMITPEQILVEGTPVIAVADVLQSEATIIESLGSMLSEKRLPEVDRDQTEVTIMGDKSLSYRLLKKVMTTCAMADFERVSLAVMQRAPDAAES